MITESAINTAAKGVTVVFVISTILYGIFIAQQILLGIFTVLLGGLIYIMWKYLRLSERGGRSSNQPQGDTRDAALRYSPRAGCTHHSAAHCTLLRIEEASH